MNKNKESEISTTRSNNNDEERTSMEAIRRFFAQKLCISSTDDDDTEVEKVIEDLTFHGLIKHWKEKGFQNIITMVGAGISTSAGIPDFRSPGSGLYDNLQKYNLPHPTAIFELDYFTDNPRPFFALAKELYPGKFKPTPSHYFIRLLHDKGLLLRHYTQNIDTLERVAGIPAEKLVEAHGTFFTNHCMGCRKIFSMEFVRDKIFADKIPECDECNSIIKPDIVFFGESLPASFHTMPSIDFEKCDLLIIMGTSLEVQPFASLAVCAKPQCLRLLINRTKIANYDSWFSTKPTLLFDHPKNTRDVAYIGDCDAAVWALVDGLGWRSELENLIKNDLKRLQIDDNLPGRVLDIQINPVEDIDEEDNNSERKASTEVDVAPSSKVNFSTTQSDEQNESKQNVQSKEK